MRILNDTQKQAYNLINAMRKAGLPAFHEDQFGLSDRTAIEDMVTRAKRLHTIAEHECNGHSYKGMDTRAKNLEKTIKLTAQRFDLTVHFDGDPRGYVVKLHAPKSDVYNTWGGAQSGYGIG